MTTYEKIKSVLESDGCNVPAEFEENEIIITIPVGWVNAELYLYFDDNGELVKMERIG